MSVPGVLETIEALGETTLIVEPSAIVAVCKHQHDSEKFDRLSAITAVDWHPSEPRFEVVYHLHSMVNRGKRLRLKCRLSGTNPEIESTYSVWRAADWYEREVYDMFGINFTNHPNLTRILMPVDWDGHPLRKDYPIHGHKYSYQSE